jgi:hypothetical protein
MKAKERRDSSAERSLLFILRPIDSFSERALELLPCRVPLYLNKDGGEIHTGDQDDKHQAYPEHDPLSSKERRPEKARKGEEIKDYPRPYAGQQHTKILTLVVISRIPSGPGLCTGAITAFHIAGNYPGKREKSPQYFREILKHIFNKIQGIPIRAWSSGT